ncbi:RimJ/RimL family protein N-acetyltransferase [Jiangella mangrovi]|uniref:RimJ/RimL family protein N-acetyltransferase n=2 Tax=Jiangella mangrovi TaxID=1524084 RepID=A0A7W9GU80_9ACTN|nr:RimJ/RimL family protein N-acetyltransferase [Jiangella mangrovi]
MTTAEHLREYHRWENDPETILGYGNQAPQSWETRAAGYEAQARSDRQTRFEIVRLTDDRPVGTTVLYVDHAVRTAEFVMVLAPEARGHGFAAEATLLTLDWAFHMAALRMVWLKVLEPNVRAVRAYEKAGFRPAGRLRQAGWWRGESCDELLMDAVRADFPGPSAIP